MRKLYAENEKAPPKLASARVSAITTTKINEPHTHVSKKQKTQPQANCPPFLAVYTPNMHKNSGTPHKHNKCNSYQQYSENNLKNQWQHYSNQSEK
jgi:hypothetical protein